MYELIIIGAGPAGLAAAVSAYENGLRRILILERDCEPGGILNQCIHNGFGLHYFAQELTGPEYAERFVSMLSDTSAEIRLNTMVLSIEPERNVHSAHSSHRVCCVSPEHGYQILETRTLILAMGCRERTRSAIAIPGTRPSGIFTAGAAQRYVNIEGFMVGKRIVILGSGDIGLIMARRLTLEGAQVLACIEIQPYPGGLTRNIVQCLDDYRIPLYLSHTVTDIKGQDRLKQVTVSKVDENRISVPGSEIIFDCDTLLLSVGLIPENELTRSAGIELDARTNGSVVYENMQTSVPGIFACGNAVHVHDLVDFVTAESCRAGKAAAAYVQREQNGTDSRETPVMQVTAGSGVSYTVPQKIRDCSGGVTVFFRVRTPAGQSSVSVNDSTGARIARFKREYLVPGEMEHIDIPAVLLKKASGSLTVSIESGGSE